MTGTLSTVVTSSLIGEGIPRDQHHLLGAELTEEEAAKLDVSATALLALDGQVDHILLAGLAEHLTAAEDRAFLHGTLRA